jgi:alpha-glucosidase (family GH31 glycosyl hydrolase)
MIGEGVLVKPVTDAGASFASVYLPGDEGWYDLETGQHYSSTGVVKVDAPIHKIPVFQRYADIAHHALRIHN